MHTYYETKLGNDYEQSSALVVTWNDYIRCKHHIDEAHTLSLSQCRNWSQTDTFNETKWCTHTMRWNRGPIMNASGRVKRILSGINVRWMGSLSLSLSLCLCGCRNRPWMERKNTWIFQEEGKQDTHKHARSFYSLQNVFSFTSLSFFRIQKN